MWVYFICYSATQRAPSIIKICHFVLFRFLVFIVEADQQLKIIIAKSSTPHTYVKKL